MSNHTIHRARLHAQVFFRLPDTFFIRDDGRTYPVSRAQLERQFGHPFAAAVAACPGMWIDFDPSEQARLECNRARYEIVGAIRRFDFDGANVYGVWDHESGNLLSGGFCRTYDSVAAFIDEMTPELLEAFDTLTPVITPPPFEYRPSTASRIAEHNVAAVDAVAVLFNMPTKPAA